MAASLLVLLLACAAQAVQARSATVRIARAVTPVATLEGVTVRLTWPDAAAAAQGSAQTTPNTTARRVDAQQAAVQPLTQGALSLHAERVDAGALGYRFRSVQWHCQLTRRGEGRDASWRCAGPLRDARGAALQLAVDLGPALTTATLTGGAARIALVRSAATPDRSQLDLTRVPLAWAQALASQAWPAGRLTAGTVDGRVLVDAAASAPLRAHGRLQLSGAAVDTQDASIAAQSLDASLGIDYRSSAAGSRIDIDGALRGGELLFGGTYITLPTTPVALQLTAAQAGGGGWQLPRLRWHDGDTLRVDGSAALRGDGALEQLDVQVHSGDATALPRRYFSGQLGVAGLAGLTMQGALDGRVALRNGDVAQAHLRLIEVSLRAADGRFAFAGLDGDLRFTADSTPVDSTLRWREGGLSGLAFGAAQFDWRSVDGTLSTRAPVRVPMLNGHVGLDDVRVQPPAGERGLRIGFGLSLEALDIGALSSAFGGPAFVGSVSGRIPAARYADDRIDFDGGVSMQVFGGRIDATALSMERPFGVAPTLSADLALRDLDLQSMTGVFGFGSISGRLAGRVEGLRLVDWSPAAFNAELHTVPTGGVRQRISQRAVQNISSVGDTSFVTSLQGKLIGLFDDFGYRRIGISCRLANDVCAMAGLRSEGNAFTIVQGSGLPRLDVVGYNRAVAWPTLLERLIAAGQGDVAPVIK